MKTNACRLLDALQIRYEAREYEVDPEDLSGQTVAMKIEMPVEQVFKTLLCRVDQQDIVFAVLSVADELDFKKLASAAGGRHAELVPIKEVQPLTGYIRGGIVRCHLCLRGHARHANRIEPRRLSTRSGSHACRPDTSSSLRF